MECYPKKDYILISLSVYHLITEYNLFSFEPYYKILFPANVYQGYTKIVYLKLLNI